MKQYMHKNCNICNEEIINKIVSCFEKLRNVDFYKDVNKYFHTLNFIKNIKEIFYEILLIKNNTEQFMLIEFLYKYIKMHIEMNELKE